MAIYTSLFLGQSIYTTLCATLVDRYKFLQKVLQLYELVLSIPIKRACLLKGLVHAVIIHSYIFHSWRITFSSDSSSNLEVYIQTAHTRKSLTNTNAVQNLLYMVLNHKARIFIAIVFSLRLRSKLIRSFSNVHSSIHASSAFDIICKKVYTAMIAWSPKNKGGGVADELRIQWASSCKQVAFLAFIFALLFKNCMHIYLFLQSMHGNDNPLTVLFC